MIVAPPGLFSYLFFQVHLITLNYMRFSLPLFCLSDSSTANSVDPDQMPRSAVSDLGLHCLPMPILLETRHKWVDIPPSIV